MKCKYCGTELYSGAFFCSNCGAKQEEPQPEYVHAEYVGNESSDKNDIESNKLVALLSYFSFLFIIPLIAAPNSKFAKFHANQGLLLFIFGVICGVVAAIPILGWIASGIGTIVTVVLFVKGVLNVLRGEEKELPFIGHYRIIH